MFGELRIYLHWIHLPHKLPFCVIGAMTGAESQAWGRLRTLKSGNELTLILSGVAFKALQQPETRLIDP
jgi:hypothetical protein